jgi:cytochrome c-type biogenesis protein CcmF
VVQLQNISGNEAEFGVKESDSVMQYVTLKAYNFPFINLLWLGILVMVLGLIMSTVRRVQLNRVPVHKI